LHLDRRRKVIITEVNHTPTIALSIRRIAKVGQRARQQLGRPSAAIDVKSASSLIGLTTVSAVRTLVL
jgi:chemotaxis signal transduction protein